MTSEAAFRVIASHKSGRRSASAEEAEAEPVLYIKSFMEAGVFVLGELEEKLQLSSS